MKGLVLILVFFSALWMEAAAEARPKGSTQMKVLNRAGYPIELFWINVFTPMPHDLVPQTSKPIRNGTETVINSYNTHSFMAKYFNPPEHLNGVEGSFTKGPEDEQITILLDEESGTLKMLQQTAVQRVKSEIDERAQSCVEKQVGAWKTDVKELAACMSETVVENVIKETSKAEKALARASMISDKLRNYTCEDPTLETSSPVSSYNLEVPVVGRTTSRGEQAKRRVRVDSMFDSDHAKIWVAHDFVTDEECDHLMRHGGPRLSRATVAGEDGTSVISESRKAQQANYAISNRDGNSQDPLYPLYERVFQATNHHTNYNLSMDGQEDFTIIQYNVADQYTPHCDGSCDGEAHVKTGRVASCVMYCKVAESGGGTTFTNADVFVKPTKGMATFFSYKDSKTGLMDDGDTQHSGCPVLEGEKWITTVWMRDGVDKQNTWGMFDPSGLPILHELQETIAPIDTGKTRAEEL